MVAPGHFRVSVKALAGAASSSSPLAFGGSGTLVSGGTDPVDSARLPYGGTWEGLVGVEDGIPNYTSKYGSTLPTSSSASDIATAFNAAGDQQYVELASGTFNLSASMTLTNSNVVLRGQVDGNGVPTTILNFTGGSDRLILLSATNWSLDNSGQFTKRTITSGATRGSTQVTVSSTTNLETGMIVFISCPGPGGGSSMSLYTTDSQCQIVRCTSFDSTHINFEPPLNSDYMTGTIQAGWRTLSASMKLSGLENIRIDGNGNGHCVGFTGTDSCWLKNVETESPWSNGYHLNLYGTYRTEVRHCNMHTMTSTGSSTYIVFAHFSGQALFEDNYWHDCPNVMPLSCLHGSAIAYNYVTDFPYETASWLSQIIYCHGEHNNYNLIEGNWVATSYNDEFSGTTSRGMLWFRNRMLGWDANGPKTGNTECLTLCQNHNYATAAGNVMGKDSADPETFFHTTYEEIFDPGDGQGDNFPSDCIFNIHAEADTTFERFANYNTVSDGIHASEALGGGEALVTSYLHSSKPSWFGSLPWPWCTPTNYSQSNDVENFPAGYRAINGVDP